MLPLLPPTSPTRNPAVVPWCLGASAPARALASSNSGFAALLSPSFRNGEVCRALGLVADGAQADGGRERMSEEAADRAVAAADRAAAAGAPKVTLEPLILVAGDTFKVRNELKAIGGGVWCKPFNGWVFSADQRDAITATLDKAGSSYTDSAPGTHAASAQASSAEAIDAAKEASTTASAGASLTVAPHKKAVIVTGDTMKVKDILKGLKGSWNKTLKGWVFPGSQRDLVLETLRADPTNTVSEAAASTASPAAKRQKKSADDEFIDDDDSD